jgi:long-chain fatty acid transport protein
MLRKIAVSAASLLWSSGVLAAAGGLTLPEQGGPISGTSQAGQAAVAQDASTAWLNPAGLTRLEETELLAGVQILSLTLEFDPDPLTTTSGSDGGDAGGTFPAGSIYIAVPVTDRITLGASVTAPFGLPIEYKSDWVGRSFATELELITINVEPSMGFKINEQLSVGIGIDFQYADLEQELIVPIGPAELKAKIDADNWEVGASLGVLYEPSQATRFGLIYRTEMDHDLDGDLETIGTLQTSANLTIPQSLTVSAYHELDNQWALLADAGWTDWSAFDKTVINISNAPIPIEIDIPRDWKDTWNVGFGAHYQWRQGWRFMTGVAYVSSAVNDADRTPDIPVDEQWRLSVGVENEVSGNYRWGIVYTYADLGDNELDATNFTGRVAGDYDTPLHILGAYGSWMF